MSLVGRGDAEAAIAVGEQLRIELAVRRETGHQRGVANRQRQFAIRVPGLAVGADHWRRSSLTTEQ
jgi:hypothetical protein